MRGVLCYCVAVRGRKGVWRGGRHAGRKEETDMKVEKFKDQEKIKAKQNGMKEKGYSFSDTSNSHIHTC